jgi:nucleoside phosphorylase
MVSWTRADVVILTAIELEYAAVKQVEAGAAPGSSWVEDKHNGLPVALREFVTSKGDRLRIAVGRAPDMGKGSAVATLQPLVDALRPSCIAMCGVCAGRPGKTGLGDVIVGERLYDYDAGKWTDVGFHADPRTYSLPAPWKIAAEQFDPKARFGGEGWWKKRPVPYEWQELWALFQLHEGVKDPTLLRECKKRCPLWSTVIENLWASGDLKHKTLSLTKQGQQRAGGVVIRYPVFPNMSPSGKFMPFRMHVAPIGSGSAVREDASVWGFLTPHMRKTLGLEMEASALAEIVRAREHHDPIKAVVMKGVMDFANHGRDDHFKDWAARASAECLIAFLREQLAGISRSGERREIASPVAPSTGETDAFKHDLFIMHADADAKFVRDVLLSAVGLDPTRVLLSNQLALGRPKTAEIERGVQASRFTLVVLSPAYMADRWAIFGEQLASHQGEGRLIPLLLEECKVPLRLDSLVTLDFRKRDDWADEARRLREHLTARSSRSVVSPQSWQGDIMAASASTALVAASPAGRTPVSGVTSPEILERLARMKREVAALVKARPRPFTQLATRIGCQSDPEVLANHLVNLRGSVVAEHVLAVCDEQPSTLDGDADRDALQSVLFTVLPYVSDWLDEVAACCARAGGEPSVVELRYRSSTIAEAVMAGWTGRRCFFEHKAGDEPYGVGAVQIPAAAQTALFTSERHLLEEVVHQLRRQLGTGGLNLHEQRTKVQATLRIQGRRVAAHRMRYYFLFHDAASPGDPAATWRLAQSTFHREDGLPSLALVRMQGRGDDDEADLEACIAEILKAPDSTAIVSESA